VATLSAEHISKLENEANMWVATVRPDGRPHLTPVWFAWYNDRLYICIQPDGVKARNLRQNPAISLALENGSSPVICEGRAAAAPPPYSQEVIAVFKAKYDWDITTDGEYNYLVEITPLKWLAW
jgi:F420H(2)-dependent biliverdin reductase